VFNNSILVSNMTKAW